jgi:biopolymer transport protein ExbB
MIRVSGLMRAFAAAVVLAGASLNTFAAAPGNLDALLEETRSARQREQAASKERETRFAAERDKQAALLRDARNDLAEQQRRSAALSAEFDANEKRLTAAQTELDSRAGNLGEMFGVVRQVANDFSSVARTSMITAQYPDREQFIVGLSQTRSLPSIQDLERFWFELQREMTETGKVVRFKAAVVTPEGTPADVEVVRVGPFNAMTNGSYLAYLPSQKQFSIMARQPTSEFTSAAKRLQDSKGSFVESTIDPTRGVLLSIYAQRPNLLERIEHGESVGYVIIVVGIVGACLLLYQLFYLAQVRGKVRNQLRFPNAPEMDNPLGRVLAAFKGDGAQLEEDPEVAELRINEAVLKEVPRLERFQPFLRLAVAAGPLLGLIGTVIGMIITFQSITESGSSDPKLMANGISQAMIATLLGLGIAVPLLFGNAWLASLSRSIVQILDEQSTGLLAEQLERKQAKAAHA